MLLSVWNESETETESSRPVYAHPTEYSVVYETFWGLPNHTFVKVIFVKLNPGHVRR